MSAPCDYIKQGLWKDGSRTRWVRSDFNYVAAVTFTPSFTAPAGSLYAAMNA